MLTVVHLIPYHAIGGVERAAQSMLRTEDPRFSFTVETIFPDGYEPTSLALYNPITYFFSVWKLCQKRPTLLIVSLWRAYAAGVLVKLFLPRTRLVVFLHYPRHVHFIDSFFTRLSAFLSFQVWADSRQTLLKRLPKLHASKGRVISFVTDRVSPIVITPTIRPAFIFWGRIHPQKNLLRALRVFAGVFAKRPDARFTLIGPDGGDLPSVRNYVYQMGLLDAVEFRGSLNFSEICEEAAAASFYLQTSHLEGMAMSVVEAMQLGLVPVVTPVGEIAEYTQSGINSLHIHDDNQVIEDILSLLNDFPAYYLLRANAISTWRDRPIYKDDVLRSCHEILSPLIP